ncbi:hypothetical protein K439DRAFT_1619168 [Ramaria rubella]|nr:hypothetical protein K439DRAFT_1619168 [Ramaria rubella]
MTLSTLLHPPLCAFACTWHGVAVFSTPDATTNDLADLSPIMSCVPAPEDNVNSQPPTFRSPLLPLLSPPSYPPTYTLHALCPIACTSYIVAYTCALTPGRMYLSELTSLHVQLGILKQGVHLIPPLLELCLGVREDLAKDMWITSVICRDELVHTTGFMICLE